MKTQNKGKTNAIMTKNTIAESRDNIEQKSA